MGSQDRPGRGSFEQGRQYTGFADVYDEFMDNVPYDDWAGYLAGLMKEHGAASGIVCELGCGTGKITRRLKNYGYDMIGIDNSSEMLRIARSKEKPGDESILYLLQDMREFELYGTVAAVVSICDSINYITDARDLMKVFRLVNNYLDIGGVFIFDVNTLHYYRDVLGSRTICDNRGECSLIWENEYDRRSRINTFELTLYMEQQDGLYSRHEETHYQRAYELGMITRMLEKAGMKVERCYRAFTKHKGSEGCERVYFVARTEKKE